MMGVVASISSYVAGRFGSRFPLVKVIVFCCLATSILYLPPMLATTVAQLTIFVALTELFKGGLLTSSNALVAMSASRARQGLAFGLAQSAQAAGWGTGPVIAGSLASVIGIRYVFGIGALVYLVTGVLVAKYLKPVPAERS